MRRALWISIALSGIAGIACAQWAVHLISFRDKLGTLCGRGHLLALVHGRGICQSDVDRALRESDYARDIERSSAADIERRFALRKLIANSAAQWHAASEEISGVDLRRNIDLLRSQFPSDKMWRQSLRANGLSTWSVAKILRNDLQVRQWISKQIAHDVDVNDDECRRFYDSHLQDFVMPERRRVSHLFLAAPPETAPEIVETKRTAIEALSVRLAAGEDFAALAAQNSEDEATKLRGGDLGYFSATRMPPDFVEAATKLRSNEISQPIRSRLGFHILKLIDIQPARQRSFDEVHNDIAINLANQKRAEAVKKSAVDLGSEAQYLRPL